MYLCKYNLSKECKGTHKDCVNCVLEDIKKIVDNWNDDENAMILADEIKEILDENTI